MARQGFLRRGAEGFSLLEILILSASLIPVLLILISLFPYAYGLNGQARALATAQELAQTELERLRAAEFDALAPSASKQGDFAVAVTLVNHPPVQNPVRQKRATVTVSWGREKSLQVQTLLFRWARS